MAEEKKKKSSTDRRRERNQNMTTLKAAKLASAQAEPDVLAGIQHLNSRKGVEWHEGIWVDEQTGRPTTRMDYCLGDDMVNKLMESRLAKEGDKQYCISSREDAIELLERMYEADCFFRVDRREHNDRLLLIRSRNRTFEDSNDAAYIITFEGSKTLRYVIGTLIVLGFFLACLFPVWPDAAKYAVRDCSRYLLVVMLAVLVPVTVLRPIVAGITGWWFLPNLWIEEEFFASFVPTWQPPPKNRDAKGDALATVIVTVIVFSVLYAMLITEVPDPDAPAPEMGEEERDAMFDDLLEKEDIFDPDAAAAEEESSSMPPAPPRDDLPPPPPTTTTDAPDLPDWGDEDEEEDPDLMAEFLAEKKEEQRKLDKKNPYREDKKRKVIHGGV